MYPEKASALDYAANNPTASPARATEFDRESRELSALSESAHSTVSLLRERLHGVLRPGTPTLVEQEKREGTSTPLGGYLRSEAEKAASINSILSDILSRLEL